MSDVQSTEHFGLARKLAHNDKAIRDEAMASTGHWLAKRGAADVADYLKLWKALYYCMWMSDKPLVQDELAESIAGLIARLDPSHISSYLTAFFQTMLREWHTTDKLRLDKYMSLVRKSIKAIFAYIFAPRLLETATTAEQQAANDVVVAGIIDVITSTGMCVSDPAARGLALHITDVFVDELSSVLNELTQNDEDDNGRVFTRVQTLLSVFVDILRSNSDKVFIKRVKDNVFMRLLDDADSLASADDDTEVDLSRLMMLVLLHADQLAGMCFDAAADPDTSERSRSALYDLRRRFLKLHAQVQSSLVESDDEAANDMPDVAPIASPPTTAIVAADLAIIDAPVVSKPVVSKPDVPVAPVETKTAAAVTVTPDAPVAGKKRRRRRDSVTIENDPMSTPVNSVASVVEDGVFAFRDDSFVSTPKRPRMPSLSDAGGDSVPCVSGGDAPACIQPESEPCKAKSVSFSATKSVRKFNKSIPIKVTASAKELVQKKSPGSVLKKKKPAADSRRIN